MIHLYLILLIHDYIHHMPLCGLRDVVEYWAVFIAQDCYCGQHVRRRRRRLWLEQWWLPFAAYMYVLNLLQPH